MDEKLKKDILKHLGVYRVMTETALKDRSIDFARRKILKKFVIEELNTIINQLGEL